MSQHDLTIANQGFPAFRADLNDALQALGSCQSGTSAPSPTFANQLWYDTTNNIVKIRNEDNDAWISLLTLDQVADAVSAIGSISLSSISDVIANAVTLTGTQTITNKTLTNPVINGFTGNTAEINIGSGQIYKDTGGRIGFGVTNPGQKVVISGESNTRMQIDGTTTAGIFFTQNGTDAGTIRGTSSGGLEFLSAAGGLTAALKVNGDLQFNSGYGSVTTAYGCRAWVNFNGTGTPSIRASGNVSSITDNGTGDYTVNFTNSMPDANYCSTLAFSRYLDAPSGNIATNNATGGDVAPTTTALRIGIFLFGSGGRDVAYLNVAIFR